MTEKTENKTEKKEGLVSEQDMKATGDKTGKIAKRTFQYDGMTHTKGEEVLGLNKKQLKEVADKGLLE